MRPRNIFESQMTQSFFFNSVVKFHALGAFLHVIKLAVMWFVIIFLYWFYWWLSDIIAFICIWNIVESQNISLRISWPQSKNFVKCKRNIHVQIFMFNFTSGKIYLKFFDSFKNGFRFQWKSFRKLGLLFFLIVTYIQYSGSFLWASLPQVFIRIRSNNQAFYQLQSQ